MRLNLPKMSDVPMLPGAVRQYKKWEAVMGEMETAIFGGSTKSRKWPVVLIAAAVVAIVCLLQYLDLGAVNRLEMMTYDARVRMASRHPGQNQVNATNLALVEIGDQAIDLVNNGKAELGYSYGLYWPRSVYAMALQELSRQRAGAAGLDVLFSGLRPEDPDPPDAEKLADGSQPASSDGFFQAVLNENTNMTVILGAQDGVLPDPHFQNTAALLGDITSDGDADGVLRRVHPYEDMKNWHPYIQLLNRQYDLQLDKTVIGTTNVTFFRKWTGEKIVIATDKDGFIDARSISSNAPPLSFLPFTPIRVWSMGVVLAAKQLKLDLDHAQIEPRRIVLRGSNNVTRVIPLDSDGRFEINWELNVNNPAITEWPLQELLRQHRKLQLHDDKDLVDLFKDKLVMIGSTATGNDLTDLGPSPLGKDTHLVLKHINVANSIIANRFVTPSPVWLAYLLIAGMGALAAWINLAQARPTMGTALMALAVAAYAFASGWLYLQSRFVLPIFLPLVCSGLVTHIAAITYRVRAEQTEKKRVKSVFSKMLAPEVVEELLDAKKMALGGTRREISIYFADVRGFTSLTDRTQAAAAEYIREHKLSPVEAEAYYDKQAEETLATVSTYLGTIAGMIKRHQGTLDKYIGDCVMAFWGGPVANSRHACDAVQSAIDAQRAVLMLNVQREADNKKIQEENTARAAQGIPPVPLKPLLSMGTGINSGSAIMGLMGSEEHQLSYTVFGREVNLASRLEGLSGHSRIIISEATYKALDRDDKALAALCVERMPADVKGFRHAVKNYEVLWRTPELPEDPESLRVTAAGAGAETGLFAR